MNVENEDFSIIYAPIIEESGKVMCAILFVVISKLFGKKKYISNNDFIIICATVGSSFSIIENVYKIIVRSLNYQETIFRATVIGGFHILVCYWFAVIVCLTKNKWKRVNNIFNKNQKKANYLKKIFRDICLCANGLVFSVIFHMLFNLCALEGLMQLDLIIDIILFYPILFNFINYDKIESP
jgi:RsiW-degrading membrane proteinase PrsW (M82 family)